MRVQASRHHAQTYGTIDTVPESSLGVLPDDSRQPDSSMQGRVTEGAHERTRKWMVIPISCLMVIAGTSAAVRAWSSAHLSPGNVDPDMNVLSFSRNHVKVAIPFSDDLPPLAFTALNYYHIRDGKPGQEYPWLQGIKLIEPYRNTTLAVTSPRDGFHYRWEVRDGDKAGRLEHSSSGAEIRVLLTRLEENMISLQEVDPNGAVTRQLDETVMVKYVRREIRALKDSEREELFDAMHTLYTVTSTSGGTERFGHDYVDVLEMGRVHFAASSEVSCDHFHDGLGFFTSHSVFTNTFEYSLQLVNPKLTVPYWDFTIESTYADDERSQYRGNGDAKLEPQFLSPLLQTSWFGTTDPRDNQVKGGRWGGINIPKVDQSNGEPLGDVYGRLRSPWTANERPFISRGLGDACGARLESSYPWPSCETHYKLTTAYSDFYGWVWDSQYDPHGNVHIWLGGVLDCKDTYDRIRDLVGEETGNSLAILSFSHRKNFYRDEIWYCSEAEKSRGVEIKGITPPVRCGCLDYDLTEGDDYIMLLESMLSKQLLDPFDADTKRTVVSMICDAPVNPGDHLQSISSLDPLFWPMHPTMERLWMFKQLAGTMTDMTWLDGDGAVTLAEGSAQFEHVSLYSDDCVGHRGSDVYPFGLLNGTANDQVRTGLIDVKRWQEITDEGAETSSVRRSSGGNTLTNRELLRAFDPHENSLTYIYDTFRWDHCSALGFDFNDAREDASRNDHTKTTATSRMSFRARQRPKHVRPTADDSHSGAAQR